MLFSNGKNLVMKFCLYLVEAAVLLRICLKHMFYIKPSKTKCMLKIKLVHTFYAYKKCIKHVLKCLLELKTAC